MAICARMNAQKKGTPKGWHETRMVNRSGARKAFAQAAPRDERPLVLEIRSTVALCCDAKSRDRSNASTQSGVADDREMDSADAERVFRRGTPAELRRQASAKKNCSFP